MQDKKTQDKENPEGAQNGDNLTPDPVTRAEFDSVKDNIDTLTTTLNELTQNVSALVEKTTTVFDTMQQLEEWKKSKVERTQAEIMNANSQQLEAAQAINKTTRRSKTLEDYGFQTVRRDILNDWDSAKKEKQEEIWQTLLTHPTDDPMIHDLHKHMDSMKLRCNVLGIDPHQSSHYPEYKKFLEDNDLEEKIISIAGAPANYVPASWSAEMLSYYYQDLMVASAIDEFMMPTDPFNYDLLGRPTTYLRGQPTASTRGSTAVEYEASDPAQAPIPFTTIEMAARVDVARRFNEDMLDTYFSKLTEEMIPGAMAEAKENATINGDDSSTSFDTSITAANSVRKAYKGLRWHAHTRGTAARVDIEASGAVYSFDRFADVLAKGGKYFIKPDENVWVLSNAAYFKALKFDEIKTLEHYSMPTNINGVVNVILGRPVIVSGEYPQTLNATGIDPSSAGSKTGFLCFNKKSFMYGERREDEVSSMMDTLTGFYYFVATNRHTLQMMEPPAAGVTPVVTGVNLSP